MARWEPEASERLKVAALDLYATRGYDNTTVVDIAAHAGLTPRTYFRYFTDKREVLFGGTSPVRARIRESLARSPDGLSPLDGALQAIRDCSDLYRVEDHEWLSRRDAVISSADELREREGHKLGLIARDITEALVVRGTDAGDAELIAGSAVAVLKQAASRWIDDPTIPFEVRVDQVTRRARELWGDAPAAR